MEDPFDLNTETEDLINLPASSNPGDGSENNGLHSSNCEHSVAESLPTNSEVKGIELNREILEKNGADVGNEDGQPFLATNNDQDVDSTTIMQVSVELNGTIIVKKGTDSISSTVHVENGLVVQDGSPLSNKRDGSSIRSHDMDDVSGVKRPRITVDEPQASVHVKYNSLTRDSKRKLEELLQKWSEWHSRHYSASHDSKDELESGERTYFPALHVGVDKPSAVSFWIDSETRNLQSKEFVPLDNNSIPLYDRGYSFGLTSTDGSSNPDSRGLEIVDASRCFNCGSYNHSLKECPKPRDNAAVNSARKQLKSRRNQNGISRNPTRYYQDTPGGKFDGLRPGVLDVETRRLLGLGELDPPPWLNRMREIGYPPGYLDPEVEDLPSGITIFGDEEKIIRQETEDGEILDTDHPEPSQPELPRKMSVEFPGLNAPIPENADERRWAGGPSSFDPSRNRPHRRFNHSTEPISKPHYHEQRWSRDFRDDGPPGVDPGSSPLMPSFSPRYGDFDSGSPSYGRSLSERGRRSPLVQETSSYHDYHRSENRERDRWGGFSPPDYSSHRKDKHEEHLRQSRR